MQAEKQKVVRLLKTARGQLDGLLKMVDDDRYCMDISDQILATTAILRKVNSEIIHAHLHSCVKNSLNNEDSEQKIEEILKLFDKLSK